MNRLIKVQFVPEINGKRVCDPYNSEMEAEAFGSGYATAYLSLNRQDISEVDVQIVTVAEDGTEIERQPL